MGQIFEAQEHIGLTYNADIFHVSSAYVNPPVDDYVLAETNPHHHM
jgi:hypothetical protein